LNIKVLNLSLAAKGIFADQSLSELNFPQND